MVVPEPVPTMDPTSERDGASDGVPGAGKNATGAEVDEPKDPSQRATQAERLSPESRKGELGRLSLLAALGLDRHADADGASMTVRICRVDEAGRPTLILTVNASTIVLDMKQTVERAVKRGERWNGLPICLQALEYQGTWLNDEHSVAWLQIPDGAVLNLTCWRSILSATPSGGKALPLRCLGSLDLQTTGGDKKNSKKKRYHTCLWI